MAVYTDNFDALTGGGNDLAGQGNWILGLNRIIVWTPTTGDNEIGPYTSSAYVAAIHNQTYANNQYAQIKRTKVTSDGAWGVGVRLSGSGATFCGYALVVKDSATGYSRLVKFTNGVASILGSTGTTPTALNDVYKLQIVGGVLTAYKNGSVFTEVGTSGSYTDTTYTTGKAGVVGYGTYNDTLADEFAGGDVSSGVAIALAGTITGVAAVTVALSVKHSLITSIAGVAAVTGNIKANHNLIADADGVATVTGLLRKGNSLVADADGGRNGQYCFNGKIFSKCSKF